MKNRCVGCANYIQHYAFLEGAFRPVFCGHCMKQRKRHINQSSIACEEYISGESVE